ncbi:MAG: hypothetical protein ACI97A_001663 [Planctomycetota bacterium]|jgi:hypothetical protein
MTRALFVLSVYFFSAALYAQAPESSFDVHEWGTFTSMQGSQGLTLEGLQHEEERLPDFVYSRTEVRECPLRDAGYKGLEVPVTHVTQKMETPVIYFHSKTKRKLRVRVDFIGGLLTQWYPVSNLLGPPEASIDKGPLDLKTVKSSFLEWDIDIIPARSKKLPKLPIVPADDIWNLARQVDACYVQTHPRLGKGRLGPVEAERYLFYRGLGTFALPFSIEMKTPQSQVFKNTTPLPISFAVALEVRGDTGRIVVARGIEGGKNFDFSFADSKPMKIDQLTRRIEKELMDAIISSGMTTKEAKAMVKTWARSWFKTEGNRVLYLVPRELIDKILPLQISPKPANIERVLVGRLEYITKAREDRAAESLLHYNSANDSEKAKARKYLTSLDRFLEPHVRCVLASNKNAVVKENGATVLALLKEEK